MWQSRCGDVWQSVGQLECVARGESVAHRVAGVRRAMLCVGVQAKMWRA